MTPDALAVLQHPPTGGRVGRLVRTLGLDMLSQRMHTLVAHGHTGMYPSPSEGRLALANAAVAVGYDATFLFAVLLDPSCELGRTFRRRTPSWRHTEVVRLVTKSQDRINRTDVTGDIVRYRHHVAATLNGRTGATDLAVAEAIAVRAERYATTTPVVPLADIAIEAGVTRKTARRAIGRLVANGCLTEVRAPTTHRARVVRLNVPSCPKPWPVPDGARDGRCDLGGDHARWRALGKVAARTWRELSPAPRTVEEIASATGATKEQARARLWRLKQDGLAINTPNGWIATCVTADDVAALHGTLGLRERERDELDAERTARRASKPSNNPTIGGRGGPTAEDNRRGT